MPASSSQSRQSQVRAALAWGRRQVGDGEAAALAERAAALALTPRVQPSDLGWARELAARAAAMHIAFAALERSVAALERRMNMTPTWRGSALQRE